jgi:multidrug resistance protein
MKAKSENRSSPLFIIFTTVLIDLIGFGMVIPLIGLYGRHYGAHGFQLSILGGIYSLMQFFFAPFWGALSDRVGRRPVLLISLAGSTCSYIGFAMAPNYLWLLCARALGGIFAANISTAQAYIADVTTPQDRAKGMGLLGAAFGIGFTLGPPLGGIASVQLGLSAPGWIAASICGLNALLAVFRLPESFPPELRRKRMAGPTQKQSPGFNLGQIARAFQQPELKILFFTFFAVTFAFSTMEQTFSLLFQTKFGFETGEAGYRTGLVLMVAGLVGAVIQGGLIRKLVPRWGERNLLLIGLGLSAVVMAIFPWSPSYPLYFLIVFPMAIGSSLINPSLASLISRAANAQEQGSTLGVSQGLGSLARALGPFCGLMTFAIAPEIPYVISSAIYALLLFLGAQLIKESQKKATHSEAAQ